LAGTLDLLLSAVIAQQTVVTDLHETLRQNVQAKTSQELGQAQRAGVEMKVADFRRNESGG
jgi:hypothetical protein